MSTSTHVEVRRARARATASKATAPGSEPAAPVTISQPARCAHAFELLGRGGAVGVGGGEQHAQAELSRSCQASLPSVVVLPVPLTPTIRITVGFGRRSIAGLRIGAAARDVGEQRGQPLAQRLLVRAAPGAAALELARRPAAVVRGAHVGEDQRLLEPLPVAVVERPPRARLDLAAERLAGRAQALPQPRRSARGARLADRPRRAVLGAPRGRAAATRRAGRRGQSARRQAASAPTSREPLAPSRRETTLETPSPPIETP